jgi:hypothetical protein
MVGIAEEPPRQLAPSVGSATLDFVIRARSFFFNKLIQIVSVEAINVKQHDGQIDAADKLYLFVLGIAPLAARHGESAKTNQNCTKQTRWKASMLDQVPRFKHQKKKKKNQQESAVRRPVRRLSCTFQRKQSIGCL